MIKNKIIAIGVLIAITMCSCLFCIFTKKDVFTVYAMEQSNNENIALTNGDKKSDSVVFIEGKDVGTSSVTSGTRSDLTEAKYIPNANYFLINPKHHKNDGSDNELGTCPTVAMQLLLGYHNYYSDRRILKSSYLASDYGNVYFDPFFNRSRESKQGCGIIGTEDTVYEEIFNRTAIADVPVIGQIIPSVVDGTKKFINQCAEEVSDEISINWGNFSASAAREDIDNGKPVAVGINLLLEANLHVVVAYGYAKIGGIDGFLVHYGWGDRGTMVWIPEGILGF